MSEYKFKPPFELCGAIYRDADNRVVPSEYILSRLNSRPSIVDGVPEGYYLVCCEVVLRDKATHERAIVGTGPTPEAAVRDAANKVAR